MIRRIVSSFAFVFLATSAAHAQTSTSHIPDHYTDAEFWKFIQDVSEPGGYFRSDNFLSNERQYEWVLNDLQKTTKPGNVYLGVGPEQNFTYIVAMKPAMAVIFDIRRQNMIQHLMYKALFEMSANRSQFVSQLFCRPLIARFDTTTKIDSIAAGYGAEQPDTALWRTTLNKVKSTLAGHGFTLTAEDNNSLDYIYHAFCDVGLALNYNYGTASQFNGGYNGGGGGGFGGRGGMPNYYDLIIATDENGQQRGYLATEENFRYMKSMEAKNLIIPVVGDFAGPKAIRAVAQYMKDRNATVNAFYASNVEQYLFQQNDDWRKYYENVATLPLDETSQFIRSRGGPYRNAGGRQQVLAGMQQLVDLFKKGQITNYGDAMALAH